MEDAQLANAIREQQIKKQVALIGAYKEVFSTAAGKLVLEDLRKNHWVGASSFNEKPEVMIFREGERNVVLRIGAIISQDLKSIEKRVEDAKAE